MTYNPATDSYQNDKFEQILDTNFRYDIPYKIDREKYADILKKHNQKMRIVDADVVLFRTDYCIYTDCSSEDYLYAFFAWPENSPEESKDFYDCFLFSDDKYENKEQQKKAYENFVHELLKCVIGVDYKHVMNVYNDILNEREELNKQLEIVENILYENKID